jgi:hypothetical protein
VLVARQLDQADQVVMNDVGKKSKFALESVDAASVHTAQHLQGDDLVRSAIARAIHDTHAALTEAFFNRITLHVG